MSINSSKLGSQCSEATFQGRQKTTIAKADADEKTIESGDRPEDPHGKHLDGGFQAWFQVFCAFNVYLCTWGIANSYGIFQTYYIQHKLPQESQSRIAWIGSVQSGLLLFVSFGAGPLFDAGYTRLVMLVGSVLTVLGLMMASIAEEYWHFVLSQGVATGVGMGLLYVPGVSVIPQYFSERKALALGIASLGSSVGSIIIPPIFTAMEPGVGFGWTLRTIAFIAVALLAVVLIGLRPSRTGTKLRSLFDVSILSDGAFIMFCLAFFFGFMGVYIPFVYATQYAISVCDMSAELASYMLTFLNAGSFFGRVIPNYLADYVTGPMNIHIPLACCALALTFAWMAIDSSGGIITFSVLYGFCSGTFVSLGGAICFNMTTDPRMIGTRLGVLTAFCSVGLLVGSPIAGAVLDHAGWKSLQAFTGASMAVSVTLMIWARVWRYGARIAAKV